MKSNEPITPGVPRDVILTGWQTKIDEMNLILFDKVLSVRHTVGKQKVLLHGTIVMWKRSIGKSKFWDFPVSREE